MVFHTEKRKWSGHVVLSIGLISLQTLQKIFKLCSRFLDKKKSGSFHDSLCIPSLVRDALPKALTPASICSGFELSVIIRNK